MQQSCRNGNKLLPETATLLPFSATICCLVWTGLKKKDKIPWQQQFSGIAGEWE